MTDETKSTATESGEKSPSLPRRLAFDRTARLALIAVLLWVGWSTMKSMAFLVSGSKSPRQTDVAQPVPVATRPDELLEGRPADGFWTFAGSDWQAANSTVPEKELRKRLESVGKVDEPQISETTREGEDFLRLLRMLASRSENPDGGCTYSLDDESLRSRVVTQMIDNVEHIVGGAGAVPLGDGTWRLVELRRRSKTATNSAKRAAYLLPVPAGTQRVFARWTHDDTLLLEAVLLQTRHEGPVEPPSPRSHLLRLWENEGWQAQALTPSYSGLLDHMFIRGDETIRAWSAWTPGDRTEPLLVLVRVLNTASQTDVSQRGEYQ